MPVKSGLQNLDVVWKNIRRGLTTSILVAAEIWKSARRLEKSKLDQLSQGFPLVGKKRDKTRVSKS